MTSKKDMTLSGNVLKLTELLRDAFGDVTSCLSYETLFKFMDYRSDEVRDISL